METDRPSAGIGWMCLAILFLTIMDSTAKHLAQTYPLGQVVWARYAFNLCGLLALLPLWNVAVWRSNAAGLQITRGLGMVVATALMFLSVKLLPLTDVYSISFVAPLLVAGLAGVFLRERVGLRRWMAILIGLVGVVIVIRPGTGAIGPAALAPLAMAMAYAVYQLVTRQLAGKDGMFVTMFWSAMIGTLATAIVLPFGWRMPGPGDAAIMVGMGMLGLAGQLAMIRAFALGPASLISPYLYTQIIWAGMIGFLVFGDVPDPVSLVGAGIVCSSGLWLFLSDARQGSGERLSGSKGPAARASE